MSRPASRSCWPTLTGRHRVGAWATPVLLAAAAVASPATAYAAPVPTPGCGLYFCLTIQTGSLALMPQQDAATYYTNWTGVFARAQSTAMQPALQSLGAASFEWHVAVVGHYVGYCAPGLVCDRDTFSDYLGGGSGVPSRDLNVFGATPDMPRDWDVRVDSPVQFAAYDAAGRLLAADRFAAAVVLTPEPASLALTAAGLVGIVVAVRRRRQG